MHVTRHSLSFFEALASETRLHIVEKLGESDLNIRELSEKLGVSASIVARHIKVLEEANIIHTRQVSASHGMQKVCSLIQNGFVLEFPHVRPFPRINTLEIPVGSYVDWDIAPTCGLNTRDGGIGYVDDVRAFSDPQRLNAAVVWLGHGYVEYAIPNYLTDHDQLEEIRIQVELCSEAPGSAMDWPSDIYFDLNGLKLGCWTCPGCYGDRRGIYTPKWVALNSNSQYGDLVQLVVDGNGSYINGRQISAINVRQVGAAAQRDFRLRLSSPADAANPGGLTIFGRGYGNFDQHILFTTVASDNRV